ncbi:hypothetical protein [Devosia sp.]|uniref:hypothetical protein n=1 Tax=Devosia sp. TaxID=1871048 RepID=UPI002EFA4B1C
MDSIESIDAVDAQTLRIRLTKPPKSFLSLLPFTNSAAVIMPEETLAHPLVKPSAPAPPTGSPPV